MDLTTSILLGDGWSQFSGSPVQKICPVPATRLSCSLGMLKQRYIAGWKMEELKMNSPWCFYRIPIEHYGYSSCDVALCSRCTFLQILNASRWAKRAHLKHTKWIKISTFSSAAKENMWVSFSVLEMRMTLFVECIFWHYESDMILWGNLFFKPFATNHICGQVARGHVATLC